MVKSNVKYNVYFEIFLNGWNYNIIIYGSDEVKCSHQQRLKGNNFSIFWRHTMSEHIWNHPSDMCHLLLDDHATFWSCCSSGTDIFHHSQLTVKSRNDLNVLVCRTRDHKNPSWCWSEPMNAIRISSFISTLVGFFPYVDEAVVKFSTKARWEIRQKVLFPWKSHSKYSPAQ